MRNVGGTYNQRTVDDRPKWIFSAIFGWNTDRPTNHIRCQITSWGGIKNEADLAFVQMAKFALPRLCTMLREQDKRARHAELEHDAFDARIRELEAENKTLVDLEKSSSENAIRNAALAADRAGKIEFLEAQVASLGSLSGKDKP